MIVLLYDGCYYLGLVVFGWCGIGCCCYIVEFGVDVFVLVDIGCVVVGWCSVLYCGRFYWYFDGGFVCFVLGIEVCGVCMDRLFFDVEYYCCGGDDFDWYFFVVDFSRIGDC